VAKGLPWGRHVKRSPFQGRICNSFLVLIMTVSKAAWQHVGLRFHFCPGMAAGLTSGPGDRWRAGALSHVTVEAPLMVKSKKNGRGLEISLK
jgi:hypothetical protein